MKEQLRDFLEFLRFNRNASPHTVAAYDSDISQFLGFTAEQLKKRGSSLDPADLDLGAIRAFVSELHRLSEGVTPAELERAKTGLKASTIMQGESTSARAGAIAHDYFIRGRIRTLEEIKDAIDGVSVEQVNAYLKTHKAGPFTIVTVGPKELKLPGE